VLHGFAKPGGASVVISTAMRGADDELPQQRRCPRNVRADGAVGEITLAFLGVTAAGARITPPPGAPPRCCDANARRVWGLTAALIPPHCGEKSAIMSFGAEIQRNTVDLLMDCTNLEEPPCSKACGLGFPPLPAHMQFMLTCGLPTCACVELR
jgi:hypothetical protein